jgi:methionyl-tRNA formyltransferase
VALRIVFCGTPAFALPSLRLLLEQPDFRIEAVITQPDRPRGRGGEVASSPVKTAAIQSGITVYQPAKIKSDEACDFFQRVRPDIVVIIAYGQIISQRLLDIPRFGWVNLHASLLPKYRGAAPINWAIVKGESGTGVTTMQVTAGLDTGPVLMTAETGIGPDETATELSVRLAEMGAPLVVETLRRLDRAQIVSRQQDDSQATLAPLLKKEDGRIDWSRPAQEIYNRIRGLQPWPGAFTAFRGKTCHVWGRPAENAKGSDPPGAIIFPAGAKAERAEDLLVNCGGGAALRLEYVQIEGRKRVTAREFATGARIAAGDRFD